MTDVRLTATNPEDSSVVPVACNAKGELLLEEPTFSSDDYVRKTGDTMSGGLHLGDKIILNATDGSATFVGGDVNIDSSGKLLVGTSSALSADSEAGTDATDAWGLQLRGTNVPSSIGLFNYSDSIFNDRPNQLVFARSRGAGSTQTILGSGDAMGAVSFQGSDGSKFVRAAAIRCEVDGTPGADDMPGRLVFSTTANGSSSPTERLRIESSGIATFASDVVISSRNKQWMIVESNGLAHLVEQTRAAEMRDTTEYPPLRDIPGELTMVEQQLQKVLEKLRMIPEAGWEVWDGSDTN